MHKTRRELANRWATTLVNSLMYEYDVPVQLPIQGIPSPRLMTFAVRLGGAKKLPNLLRLGEQMALTLSAQSCRVFRDYGNVIFEIPLPDGLCRELPFESLSVKGGLWLTLGLTSKMTPVHCRLNSPNIAPILVAGRTGAGKTEAIRLMIWELITHNTPDKLKLVVYDPKGKFPGLANSTHLATPLLQSPQDAISGVSWLMQELTNRMSRDEYPYRIVFIIDELLEYMGIDNVLGKALGRLASLGREADMHTIMATQRPDRNHLDRIGAANIGFRLVGATTDTVEAKLATGLPQTGANKLSGKGDMLGVLAGATHRVQTALVPTSNFDNLDRAVLDTYSYGMGDLKRLLSGGIDTACFPFTQRELATALTDIGILKLKKELRMGQDKATRLRNYATGVLSELGHLGCSIQ